MKIRVLYLVVGLVVIIGAVFGNIWCKNIAAGAERQSKIAAARDLENFRKSVLKIDSAEYATQRGLKFLRNGKTQEACALLDRATKLDEKYRDSHFYLGYAYLKDIEKRKDELNQKEMCELLAAAKVSLGKAQKIDPLYPMTSKLLGLIAEMENNDNGKRLWYTRFNEVSTVSVLK